MNKKLYLVLEIFGFLLIGVGVVLFIMSKSNANQALERVFNVIGIVGVGLVVLFFLVRWIIGAKNNKND